MDNKLIKLLKRTSSPQVAIYIADNIDDREFVLNKKIKYRYGKESIEIKLKNGDYIDAINYINGLDIRWQLIDAIIEIDDEECLNVEEIEANTYFELGRIEKTKKGKVYYFFNSSYVEKISKLIMNTYDSAAKYLKNNAKGDYEICLFNYSSGIKFKVTNNGCILTLPYGYANIKVLAKWLEEILDAMLCDDGLECEFEFRIRPTRVLSIKNV